MTEIEKLTENNNKLIKEMVSIRKRLTEAEKTIAGHGTLLVELRGQTAVDFHCSFEKSENII